MIVDIVASTIGLLSAPVFSFLKAKFLPSKVNNPESTLATLAVTKPEMMGSYVDAQARYLEAKKSFFNRDVIGEASRWVIDLRASIRPVFCYIFTIIRVCGWIFHWPIDPQFIALMDLCISNWFGSRLT